MNYSITLRSNNGVPVLEAGGVLLRTAEHGGRLRKYYHITSAGLARLATFKEEWREVMSIYQFVIKEDAKP